MAAATDWNAHFSLDPNLIYLNHAGVAPWPIATARAVSAFAEQNSRNGALHYPQWTDTETELRALLARLINAPSADDIALVKNTSEGLSLIAHGMHWRDGDNVVIPADEFPSNRIVWESLQAYGVTVRSVSLNGQADPEAALIAACDRDTRLLSVSSVQFGNGLQLDLLRLGELCHRQGYYFCVDAIQSLGAIAMDVEACQADFVVADGHKWLLAPEGLGVFYCRAERRDELQLRQHGWHMVEHLGDFSRRDWQAAQSARRFEPGSPNMLGVHALHASVSLLLTIGMPVVQARVLAHSAYLFERIAARAELTLLSDPRPGRHAGIVTFTHRRHSAESLYSLLRRELIVCAVRGGGIRFSPHFYTPEQQLMQALDAIPA